MSDKHYTRDDSDPSSTVRADIHQADDRIHVKAVLGAFAFAVVFSLLLVGVMTLLLRHDEARIRPKREFPERTIAPPRADVGIRQGLFPVDHRGEDLNRAKRRVLASWGWIDRAQGIVHLPIDVAIDLVARGAAPGGGAP